MSDFVHRDSSSGAARIISALLNDRHSNEQRGGALSETEPAALGKGRGSLLVIQKEIKRLCRSKRGCMWLLDECLFLTDALGTACVYDNTEFSHVFVSKLAFLLIHLSKKPGIMLLLCIEPLQNIISIYISLNMFTSHMVMLTWPSRCISSNICIQMYRYTHFWCVCYISLCNKEDV